MATRKFTLLFGVLLLVLWAALLPLSAVTAHADYERSDPEADATLTEAPTHVRIWFTQELFRRQDQNSIEVQDEAGQRVDLDDATVDDDDRALLTVSLSAGLADGVYRVLWLATSSEDGHPSEGEFAFTLAGTSASVNANAGAEAADALPSTPEEDVAEEDVNANAETADALPSTPEENVAENSAEENVPSTSVAEAASAQPTAAPSSSSPTTSAPGLPCAGGAVPLVLMLGAVWMQRRQSKGIK